MRVTTALCATRRHASSGDERAPLLGCRSSLVEAGGSPIPGARVKGGSSPDEGEADWNHRTVQRSLSETERCNGSEPVVETPQA